MNNDRTNISTSLLRSRYLYKLLQTYLFLETLVQFSFLGLGKTESIWYDGRYLACCTNPG
jgi:hypothetical protein